MRFLVVQLNVQGISLFCDSLNLTKVCLGGQFVCSVCMGTDEHWATLSREIRHTGLSENLFEADTSHNMPIFFFFTMMGRNCTAETHS